MSKVYPELTSREMAATNADKMDQLEGLLAAPDLAEALENEQFKRFLDNVPIAVVVADLRPRERIVYVNREFEKVSGQSASDVEGRPWAVLDCHIHHDNGACPLGEAIVRGEDRLGTFQLECEDREPVIVDAYANVIEDEDGTPTFRLAALVDVTAYEQSRSAEFEQQIREKDTLLREIQHRVKNNLQMITALIRIEAREARKTKTDSGFDRLAGRIEALQLLYDALSEDGQGGDIDLGIYLSRIASAVMSSHAVDGIRLNLKVDVCPVSVNVAMPIGLVVNEVLTNALKHAFVGRDGGTITLHSLVDADTCRVVIADDGTGLPAGVKWPKEGKLGFLIVQSLRENAKVKLKVESDAGSGVRVTIEFSREPATNARHREATPLVPRPPHR